MSDGSNVWSFIIGAYTVTWVGLIGYSIRLWVLNRRAKRTVAEMGGEA